MMHLVEAAVPRRLRQRRRGLGDHENEWVAPNSIAFSRLNSTGSIAAMTRAPASLAPCTALMPMPPTPTTATVSPGSDLGGVDRRAPAGDDAAAEQAGPLQR